MSDPSDLESRMRSLADATDRLSPTDELTDAIMARVAAVAVDASERGAHDEHGESADVDAKLSAMADATRDIDLAPGFTDALLRVLDEAPRTSKRPLAFFDGLARTGRTGLFVAAAIAAAAVVYASWTERRVYDETMVSADTIEVVE